MNKNHKDSPSKTRIHECGYLKDLIARRKNEKSYLHNRNSFTSGCI